MAAAYSNKGNAACGTFCSLPSERVAPRFWSVCSETRIARSYGSSVGRGVRSIVRTSDYERPYEHPRYRNSGKGGIGTRTILASAPAWCCRAGLTPTEICLRTAIARELLPY